MWDWSDMDENQRSNQEYSCGGFCSRKADTPHLLILPVSQQKEGGLLSFKCKWEYGLNPQRDGLGNGSRMPSGLWHVFISRKLIHRSYRPEHLKHELWAGHLRAKRRRRSDGRAEEHRVTLRGKLWVIIFLDKEANWAELSVSCVLTSHKAIPGITWSTFRSNELPRPRRPPNTNV